MPILSHLLDCSHDVKPRNYRKVSPSTTRIACSRNVRTLSVNSATWYSRSLWTNQEKQKAWQLLWKCRNPQPC